MDFEWMGLNQNRLYHPRWLQDLDISENLQTAAKRLTLFCFDWTREVRVGQQLACWDTPWGEDSLVPVGIGDG
jgi:hypothetical protein